MLILLVGLVALVPLAHASPPDPVWIRGIYDDADYDDVVVAAISMVSTLEGAPLAVVRSLPIAVEDVPLAVAADPTTVALLAFQIRAPPIS